MAPEGHACATSTTRSTGIASGWIHGPFTLARNTCGDQVTQKREWMQRFASKVSSSFSPRTDSMPSGALAAEAEPAEGVAASTGAAAAAVAGATAVAGAAAAAAAAAAVAGAAAVTGAA